MEINTETAEAEVQRVPDGDTANALSIVWPQDTVGFTVQLRRAGIAAAQRLSGSPKKLETLLMTLRVIGAHAKAKQAAGVQAREAATEQAASAAIAAREADLANALVVAERLAEQAAEARAEALRLSAAVAP